MWAYHTHSWYSFLEGLTDPLALLERAAAGGCAALALTDTNRLCAPAAFVAHALRVGVRPVLGACLRLQPWHCVALAADRTGYHNLCRVLSRLHLADPPRPLPD